MSRGRLQLGNGVIQRCFCRSGGGGGTIATDLIHCVGSRWRAIIGQPSAASGLCSLNNEGDFSMRGVALLMTGIFLGAAATGLAQSQGPNHGVGGLNHVALSVPDVEKAVEYYSKVMGYP